MPFAAALSTEPDLKQAVNMACAEALAGLPAPELAVLFFSAHHLPAIAEELPNLHTRLGAATLIGCVGESIVGGRREVEQGPALSLWLASWGGQVTIDSCHMTVAHTPDGWGLLGWPDGMIEADPAGSALLVLGDPFSFPADRLLLPRVNGDHAGMPVIGGMASGMNAPHQTRLVHGDEVVGEGAVGVLLRGDLRMRSVVSQGCRPIGRPL